MQSATRAAIIIVVAWLLARITSGMTDASVRVVREQAGAKSHYFAQPLPIPRRFQRAIVQVGLDGGICRGKFAFTRPDC